MRNVYLRNVKTGEELGFPSFAKATKAIGVPYNKLRIAYISDVECNGYVKASNKVPMTEESRVEFESDPPRVELDIPHYATINGEKFVVVKCTDKTNCTKCDIFKLDPPMSMIQSPLCYEYNCGTHKIVDVCSRYKCIWKRKRKSTSLK